MSTINDIFDEVMNTAKSAADFAGRKTGEAFETGKLSLESRQLADEIKKAYAKLGAIVYEAHRNGESYTGLVNRAVEDLAALNQRYDDLQEQLGKVKNNLYTVKTETAPKPEPPTPPKAAPIEVEIVDVSAYNDTSSSPDENGCVDGVCPVPDVPPSK